MSLVEIITKLRSPHADKIYLAKDYTKADLIRDLGMIEEDRLHAGWDRDLSE